MANLIRLLAIFVLTFEVITALSILAPPETDGISINYCDPSQCAPCPVPVCNCPNQPVVDVSNTPVATQPAKTLDEQPTPYAAVEPATELSKPVPFPRPYPFRRPFPRPRPCVCPPCPQIKIQCLCQL